jgi:hypothetical protein
MSDSIAREVAEAAQACYETGWSAQETVEFVAVVFTTEWSFRDRLALAWRLVRNR